MAVNMVVDMAMAMAIDSNNPRFEFLLCSLNYAVLGKSVSLSEVV